MYPFLEDEQLTDEPEMAWYRCRAYEGDDRIDLGEVAGQSSGDAAEAFEFDLARPTRIRVEPIARPDEATATVVEPNDQPTAFVYWISAGPVPRLDPGEDRSIYPASTYIEAAEIIARRIFPTEPTLEIRVLMVESGFFEPVRDDPIEARRFTIRRGQVIRRLPPLINHFVKIENLPIGWPLH